jgi:hypothetical protein
VPSATGAPDSADTGKCGASDGAVAGGVGACLALHWAHLGSLCSTLGFSHDVLLESPSSAATAAAAAASPPLTLTPLPSLLAAASPPPSAAVAAAAAPSLASPPATGTSLTTSSSWGGATTVEISADGAASVAGVEDVAAALAPALSSLLFFRRIRSGIQSFALRDGGAQSVFIRRDMASMSSLKLVKHERGSSVGSWW